MSYFPPVSDIFSTRIAKFVFSGRRRIALFACHALVWAALIAPSSAQINLLRNPGLETGGLVNSWDASHPGVYVDSNVNNVRSGIYCVAIGNTSSARQVVNGLTPNTSYLLSGWLKTSSSGANASVVLGVENHAAPNVKVFRSAAAQTYTKVTVAFTTGPNSNSATIFVYSSGAVAFGDDFALIGPNLLVNPGFETADLSGWGASYGACAAGTGSARTGSCAATAAAGSAIRQTVAGLLPGTAYVFSGWLRVSAGSGPAILGVQGHGAANVSVSTTSTSYVNLKCSFTTGAASTSATVFIFTGTAPGNVTQCDDLSLVRIAEDPTGTPARRIADCLERFGVNTFSQITRNGLPWNWGQSAGDYSSATTAKAINFIVGNSGLKMNVREYHRDHAGGSPVTAEQ